MISEFSGDFIQWLRGFYAVATTGSISRAALCINRSKPAISSQIRCLEETFGVKLFVRYASGMMLTQEGTRLLEHTTALFRMITDTAQILKPNEIHITLATNHFMLPCLTGRMGAFVAEHTNINTYFAGYRTLGAIAAVRCGDADIGIIPQTPLPENIQGVPVFSTSFVLLSAPNFSIPIPGTPSWSDIAGLPLISFAQNSTIHALLSKASATAGQQLHFEQFQTHFSTIQQMVAMGRGVTIVDEEVLTTDSLIRTPLAHLLPPRLWFFIFPTNRPLSEGAATLRQWAEEGGFEHRSL